MLNIRPAFSPQLFNFYLFHNNPISFFTILVKFKFLIESPQQISINIFKQLLDVVLNVCFDVVLEMLHKFFFFRKSYVLIKICIFQYF